MQNLILLETRAEIRVTNSSRNTKKKQKENFKIWQFASEIFDL